LRDVLLRVGREEGFMNTAQYSLPGGGGRVGGWGATTRKRGWRKGGGGGTRYGKKSKTLRGEGPVTGEKKVAASVSTQGGRIPEKEKSSFYKGKKPPQSLKIREKNEKGRAR